MPNKIKNQKNQKIFEEIDKYIAIINSYPVLHNKKERDKAEKKLIEIYKNNEVKVKQAILYVLYNLIMKSGEFRIVKDLAYFIRLNKERAKINVYKTMFDYCESLEGTIYLIKLLEKLDDEMSLKILSKILSFVSTTPHSEGMNILRNCILDILGKSKREYALEILISYLKFSENDRFSSRCYINMKKWLEKIDKKRREKILKELKIKHQIESNQYQ